MLASTDLWEVSKRVWNDLELSLYFWVYTVFLSELAAVCYEPLLNPGTSHNPASNQISFAAHIITHTSAKPSFWWIPLFTLWFSLIKSGNGLITKQGERSQLMQLVLKRCGPYTCYNRAAIIHNGFCLSFGWYGQSEWSGTVWPGE